MIDSKKILYPIGNNDECYTPSAAVKPILKYIKKIGLYGARLIQRKASL